MASTQQHRQVGIETPLGKDVLLLVSMSAKEELGRPFEFYLDLASEDAQIKFSDIVGQNVTVWLELADGSTRYFNGFISRFTQVSAGGDGARYSATMVPWLWFLTRTADCRIFQEMTVPDIIKQVFRDAGFSDFEDSLTETYRTWEYCVQYRETTFNFVSRLMEQEGIYYFFRHEDGRHVLVLADAPSAHESCPGCDSLSCQFSGAPVSEQEYVAEWVVETRIQPGSFSLNAFDFKNTKRDLHARASVQREHNAADFDVYDYSVEYTETGDGDTYARRRIEELHSQYEVATATSNARGLYTGGTFTLADHPRSDQNHEWLVTGASYTLTQSEFSSGGGTQESVYSCSLTAIGSSVPFRSARTTPQPTIPGPQTAMVVGPAGEEIHVDEYGRVKVQFHWDRYGKADENSSCWVRVGQTWAGKQWGAIYTPRIGQEVIVEFLEGDPDHPIITGRVYNGQAKPPYDLPAQKTMSTLKSNSTLGGGGFNEIRFEDKKGAEQVFIHAQKDMSTAVENDQSLSVGHDRTKTVKHEEKNTIQSHRTTEISQGNDTLTVGMGDRTVTIEMGNHMLEVKMGNCSTDVNMGDDRLNVAMGKKKDKIQGPYEITVNTQHFKIQCGASELTLNQSGLIELKGNDINILGNNDVRVQGLNIETTAQVSNNTRGAMVMSEASAVNVIRGGMVQLNP